MTFERIEALTILLHQTQTKRLLAVSIEPQELISDHEDKGNPTRGERGDHTNMKHLSEFKLDMVGELSESGRWKSSHFMGGGQSFSIHPSDR